MILALCWHNNNIIESTKKWGDCILIFRNTSRNINNSKSREMRDIKHMKITLLSWTLFSRLIISEKSKCESFSLEMKNHSDSSIIKIDQPTPITQFFHTRILSQSLRNQFMTTNMRTKTFSKVKENQNIKNQWDRNSICTILSPTEVNQKYIISNLPSIRNKKRSLKNTVSSPVNRTLKAIPSIHKSSFSKVPWTSKLSRDPKDFSRFWAEICRKTIAVKRFL